MGYGHDARDAGCNLALNALNSFPQLAGSLLSIPVIGSTRSHYVARFASFGSISHAIPQLALWATDIAARYAGCDSREVY